jgi:hypothetical protein
MSAMAILTLLLVRFPHTTWPEQLGLLVGLFGVLVVGHWWFGLAGWFAARMFWMREVLKHSPEAKAQSS